MDRQVNGSYSSDLLTLTETCRELGVTPRRVHQLRAAGILATARTFGQSPAFAPADVERAKLRCKVSGRKKKSARLI